MARGVADVLDAYLEPPLGPARLLSLLVPLDAGARISAGVALRLLAGPHRKGLAVCVEPADLSARALCGDLSGDLSGGFERIQALIATTPPTSRPDSVLALVGAGGLGSCAIARWLPLDPQLPVGVVEIGATWRGVWPRSEGLQWLAEIPECDALRAALGAEPRSVRRAAGAVASWLARLTSQP